MAQTISAVAGETTSPSMVLTLGDKIEFTATSTASLQMCESAYLAGISSTTWDTALSASGAVYATKDGSVFRIVCTSGTATAVQTDGSSEDFLTAIYDNGGLYATAGSALTPEQAAALAGLGLNTTQAADMADRNRHIMKYGQRPHRSSRVVSGGKAIYRFLDHTALTTGGTNIAHVTLSTVSGVNGVASDSSSSPTGSATMIKLSGNASATGTLLFTVPAAAMTSVDTDGRLGLWIYCDPANASVPTLNVSWSTNATITGELNTYWNSNQIRPGRNFLVFDQSAASHPFGADVSYGSADLINNNLRCFRLEFSTLANCDIYLDSLWTGFQQKPQIVLGWDSADQDVIDYVLPAMQERGWKGYIAEPCFVWSSGSVLYDNHAENGDRVARMNVFDAAGWDFPNHTTTHRAMGSLSNDYEIWYEIQNQRTWAHSHGWVKGSEFYVSPQSSTSVLAENTIAASGIVAQRHAKHRNVHVTQFGVDNPHSIGSYDIGNVTYAAIKAVIDVNVAYLADTFLFGHNTVAGGAVDGSTIPGVSTQTYYTTLILVLDYIKSLESAGLVTVANGFSGWYYEGTP
jgi:hypothetical protein